MAHGKEHALCTASPQPHEQPLLHPAATNDLALKAATVDSTNANLLVFMKLETATELNFIRKVHL